MTAVEILEKKEVLNHQDMMIILQCKERTAYNTIKAIKSVSDRIGLSGRIHKQDYFDYLNRVNKKNEQDASSGKSTSCSLCL